MNPHEQETIYTVERRPFDGEPVTPQCRNYKQALARMKELKAKNPEAIYRIAKVNKYYFGWN